MALPRKEFLRLVAACWIDPITGTLRSVKTMRGLGKGGCMQFRPGQLQYFVTVAEEGQITRAAKKLHIAQPALSQSIAQLEDGIGLKLLDRHARGVTLTDAGKKFLDSALVAVAAERDALATAQSLARDQSGTIEFGFLGAPPGLDSPVSLAAFSRQHPSIDIRFRELSFPRSPTSSWLSEVDVGVCHLPPADDAIWAELLREEPRVVLVPSRHRLADADELRVEDILDETFIGLHPLTDPTWGGFWSLDDHRGTPPRQLTSDRAANAQEVLASLAVRPAITTVPASVAPVIVSVLPGVSAIPLRGARPCSIMLIGHKTQTNQLVSAIVAFAQAWGPLEAVSVAGRANGHVAKSEISGYAGGR
jgi:DNA-binding transcriptional LysR family regulator